MLGLGDTRWDRYCRYLFTDSDTGLSVDVSQVGIPDGYVEDMTPPMARAFDAMVSLERGQIANPDEQRAVGHYWLRAPEVAPTPRLAEVIRESWTRLSDFVGRVDGRFRDLVHIGIGGSATGTQLLCDAWSDWADRLRVRVLDNADPDGVGRVLGDLAGRLDQTLVSVVSKSGITPTPWQVMLSLEHAYAAAGVDFAGHAVATTTAGSTLDQYATEHRWLARFPLWEWVGGRTSVTSMVGLLPSALAGADVWAFLDGAAAMDALTRIASVRDNPAALLALAWYWLGDGRGGRNMVILPYRDRLTVLPRWVQQLVMESVGKRVDRAGQVVHQGLTVYGYKGVTDQHAYLQQLRDGRADSFLTFVGTHRGTWLDSPDVEPGTTLSDHLLCGLLGTLNALGDRGRPAIVIMLPDYAERSLGALVAMFERAVGLYTELVDVNAYHQPGVDKNVALPILALQKEILSHLDKREDPATAIELADATGYPDRVDTVHRLLDHLAMARADRVGRLPGDSPRHARYFAKGAPPRD